MDEECAGAIDLKDTDSKYKLLFECALDIVMLIDISGNIVDANHAAIKEYGYPREKLLSMNIKDLQVPAERGTADKQLRDAFTQGKTYETIHMRKDGSEFPIEVSSCGIVLSGQKMLIAIVRDITRRREIEMNLSRFAAIVESSDDAILAMTLEGIITAWNHGAEQLYGYTAREMIGRSVGVLIPKSHAGELARILDTIKGGRRLEHYDTVRVRKDGMHVYISLTASPILGPHGKLLGVSWIARDITGRKKLEEELARAKDQAELYLDLMGHNINNMNMIAMGYLETALGSNKLGEEEREHLERTLDTLRSSARLIGNVRKLRKLEECGLKHRKIDLCEILSKAVTNCSHAPGRNITINFKSVPTCYVVANELIMDVFTNLIGNSIKHSDPRKPLTINIELEPVTENGKEYYKVTVEDDGPGIPDERKKQLFTRFQPGQAKATGKGLGLYLVRTLVSDFHGKIWVEDQVEGDHTKGTRFIVLLPAVEQ